MQALDAVQQWKRDLWRAGAVFGPSVHEEPLYTTMRTRKILHLKLLSVADNYRPVAVKSGIDLVSPQE